MLEPEKDVDDGIDDDVTILMMMMKIFPLPPSLPPNSIMYIGDIIVYRTRTESVSRAKRMCSGFEHEKKTIEYSNVKQIMPIAMENVCFIESVLDE